MPGPVRCYSLTSPQFCINSCEKFPSICGKARISFQGLTAIKPSNPRKSSSYHAAGQE